MAWGDSEDDDVMFTDTFDRSDNASTLGAPWTTHAGQFGVVSSAGRYTDELYYPGKTGWPGGSSPRVPSAATVDVGSADMAVEWDSTPAAGGHYRLFRFAAPDSSLSIGESSGDRDLIVLDEVTPAGSVMVASASSPGWQTKRVRVEAVGSAISVLVDGVVVISSTSTYNQTATRAGIGGNAIGWDPLTVTDTFDRSDNASTLGAPWTSHAGTWGIASNLARYVSGSGVGAAMVDLGSPVQHVEWDWTALAKGPSYHLFRYRDSTNFWFVSGTGGNPTTMFLFHQSGVSATLEATATGVTWGPGATLTVEAGETSIKVWTGSTLVINHSTASVDRGTRAGIGGNMNDADLATTRWSRFSGQGVDTDLALVLGETGGGPWLDDVQWARFACSEWPLRQGGIYVDGAVHF